MACRSRAVRPGLFISRDLGVINDDPSFLLDVITLPVGVGDLFVDDDAMGGLLGGRDDVRHAVVADVFRFGIRVGEPAVGFLSAFPRGHLKGATHAAHDTGVLGGEGFEDAGDPLDE